MANVTAVTNRYNARLVSGNEPGNTDDLILECCTFSIAATSGDFWCNYADDGTLMTKFPMCALSAVVCPTDASAAASEALPACCD